MSWAALAAATATLLAACGGGGGDGPAATAPSAPPSPASTPAPAPAPAPTTPATRTLAAGAEAIPTLDAPQPGSTAQSGNDFQGLYVGGQATALISPAGELAFKDRAKWVFGSISLNGYDWQFNDPTVALNVTGGNLDSVSGWGTFTAKKSMKGQYSRNNASFSLDWGPLNYAIENALAVKQDSTAGNWVASSTEGLGMNIDIDASGALSGRTAGTDVGTCTLRGSFVQTEPTTSHNLFNVTMRATNAATGDEKACDLEEAADYVGLGAIALVPHSVFPEEGAHRRLMFHVKTATGAFYSNLLQRK